MATQETHDFLVRNIIENPHFRQYPPANTYRRAFWKFVIGRLETNPDIEIDTCVYDVLIKQLQSVDGTRKALGAPEPPSPSYVTHFWHQGGATSVAPFLEEYQTVTLLESRALIQEGTTGLRTWLASFYLADFLIHHSETVQNLRVLEVGSGIGFVGVIVGSLQMLQPDDRSMLFLTDVNAEVVARCMSNVKLPCNRTASSSRINHSVLDWMDSLQNAEVLSNRLKDMDPDVIVGADVVFDPSLISPLVQTLRIAMGSRPNGKSRYALLAVNERTSETRDLFRHHVHDAGMTLEELKITREDNMFLDVTDQRAVQVDKVKLLRISLVGED
ncbi:hypothetical protein CYLTODRAFT_485356 [Cylindrobasidium torrendii FP15055 ss-10]|uniref:FAM86 N-terminal domain-containing protein n=1 Tax=Cylindrobasidium torrendii FP15055 ss-10 TaxID=1314674 RepID=A0A0D7BTC3_9AGAR|nr:hypothetical protein CYLTODRAFT_485356 [Cylindrobasidium torrendii FP15055 ss-10]